jgi:hypothetical protein
VQAAGKDAPQAVLKRGAYRLASFVVALIYPFDAGSTEPAGSRSDGTVQNSTHINGLLTNEIGHFFLCLN